MDAFVVDFTGFSWLWTMLMVQSIYRLVLQLRRSHFILQGHVLHVQVLQPVSLFSVGYINGSLTTGKITLGILFDLVVLI
jgi:hypothetical protein